MLRTTKTSDPGPAPLYECHHVTQAQPLSQNINQLEAKAPSSQTLDSKMFCDESLKEQFRSIAGENELSDKEVQKYLQWGKGNIEVALNYYFNRKTKETNPIAKIE